MQMIGQEIGGYHIQKKINQGGFGEIYQAKGTDEKIVALKILRTDVDEENQSVIEQRFLREIELMRTIKHKNIMPILSFGFKDGRLYMVMPYIEGKDLSDCLMEKHFSPHDVNHFVQSIAPALYMGHQHNILHRDLKPENILVDESHDPPHYYLLDFGLAKRPGVDRTLTMQGRKVGTPEYIAPETLRSDTVDARSDLYSFATITYELLCGRQPFSGDTMYAVVTAQVMDTPPKLTEYHAEFPPVLESVVLKGLEKKPDARQKHLLAFAQEFQAAFDSLSPDQKQRSFWS